MGPGERGRGSRAGSALADEVRAALLGPPSARLFELLNPLGTVQSVQPKGTRFTGITGPKAVAALAQWTIGEYRDLGASLAGKWIENPWWFLCVDLPGLCSVITVARRTPDFFSENAYIKEANL